MSQILFIDLSKQQYKKEYLPDDLKRKFIGGRGLGAKLLFDLVKPDTEPLSEDNKIIFIAGPLQGSGVPFSGRTQLTTKSPQTGIYLYSNAGGSFGIMMNKSGISAIVIEGKSSNPCFVKIHEGEVTFVNAIKYWGLTTTLAQKRIDDDLALEKASSIIIGPAGENLASMACLITEGDKKRTFGRGGAGAVFGSKKIKGISIFSSEDVQIVDKDELNKVKSDIRNALRELRDWRDGRIKYGTPKDIKLLNDGGIFPSYNWKTGVFDKVEGLLPEVMRERFVEKDLPCSPYCLTPCSKTSVVKTGEFSGYIADGPDYETVYSFGSTCGIDRYDLIIAANQTCDELGLDTISAGVTIGFAMECYEKKLIDEAFCDGMKLNFGNVNVVLELLNKMAYRRGLGDVLADGVRRASEIIRQGSNDFAMNSKGLEFGGYECRGSYGQALQYAMSSRGGCHHDLGLPARVEVVNGTGVQIEGKGEQVKNLAASKVVYDNAILCSFSKPVFSINDIARAISALWDEEVGEEQLYEASIRTINVERCFNILAGVKRIDDRLPKRLLAEPLPDGPHKGSLVPLEELKDEFYKSFGWDANGIPSLSTLLDLNLWDEKQVISDYLEKNL